MIRKGVLLAGGAGSRLWPITRAVSKQLLPLYSKPMVYYPLSVLMQAGIREILVVNAPDEQARFQALLGDGARWGLSLSYAAQPKPEGIAQALVIAEPFLAGQSSCLVLGDNLFYGQSLREQVRRAAAQASGATVFVHRVARPEAYGVLRSDADGRPLEIVEKPARPPSGDAVTGLYFYDARAPEIARSIRPSARGELEITSVNNAYIDRGELRVERLDRGAAWMDTGTPEDLLAASNFVHAVETRQGQMIACPEEIAFAEGWIDADALARLAAELGSTAYGTYLARLRDEAAKR